MDYSKMEVIEKYSPASEEEIRNAEEMIGGYIPNIYKKFLRETNGLILNNCVLYDTNSIVEMYEINEFKEYAPGYLSIGNDNGDYELLMKSESGATHCGFLEAGSIGSLEPDEWFEFEKWIENGCKLNF